MYLTIMLMSALSLILYLCLIIFFGARSKFWPSVKGHLVNFEIEKRIRYSKFPSIQGVDHIAIIKVKYEYQINGKKYRGKRINFGMETFYKTPEEIELDIFFQNLKSENFDVFYWPTFPGVSTLKKNEIDLKNYKLAISFTILTVSTLWLFSTLIDKIIK